MAQRPAAHIIDDDEAVRDSIEVMLETHGVAARGYASAQAFLQSVTGDTTGCIVTDLQMPDMTGLELLAELRGRGISLPVIIITARANHAQAETAVAGGAAAFIGKPFDPEELVVLLRRFVG